VYLKAQNMDCLGILRHGLESEGSQAAWEISPKDGVRKRNVETWDCSLSTWEEKDQ